MTRARRFSVIGAGIGGLAVAGALARLGNEVDVYERRDGFPRDGGMLLWSNGTKALRALHPDLERAVIAAGTVVHETEFKSWSGRRLGELPMAQLRKRYGADSVLIGRRTLVELLAARATDAGARIWWGAACDGYREAGSRVRPRLADGVAVPAPRTSDGLIACDGLRSRIRGQLFGARPLRNAYYTAWIGISCVEPSLWPYETGHTVAFLGGGLRFCASTMASAPPLRTVYWYASEAESRPDRLEQFRRRRLLALFREKSPAVAGVMAAAIEPYPEAFCIKDCEPSWRWSRGPIALLGDAAHASAPDLGQGACQALESAVVMADELGRSADVARAFARYARRRMDRTTRITTMSRMTAIMSMMHAPGLDLVRELAIRTLLPAITPGELDRLFRGDVRTLG